MGSKVAKKKTEAGIYTDIKENSVEKQSVLNMKK
jgi:hypothetical protein